MIVKVYSKSKTKWHIKFLIPLAALIFVLGGCSIKQKEAHGIVFLMDTFIEQQWYGKNAQKNYDETVSMLTECAEKFSAYDENSEIFKVNLMSGIEPVEVSPDTFSLLETSLSYSLETQGVFDITIAPLVKTWDILGENPHVPSESQIMKAKELVSCNDLILDKEKGTAFLKRKGMAIDIGGIAKGYLAQKAGEIAEKNQVSGYASIGGNMIVKGKKPNGEDFSVGLKNPRGENSDIVGTVNIREFTMATTGDYERFFIEDGVRFHHVLSPFSGYPAQTDLISVTVVSKNGALADFMSTYIFMQGSKELSRFLNDEEFYVCAIDKDKNVVASEEFWRLFSPNYDKKDFKFLNEH